MANLNGKTPAEIAHEATHETIEQLAARTARMLGVSEKDVLAYLKREVYRANYNARPEVKAARKEYTRVRNAKLATIGKLIHS